MRKLITLLFLFFILTQTVTVGLFAQSRKSAPPDTTKKGVNNKSGLELPDVLIYGEDRSKRKSGNKLHPLDNEAKIVAAAAIYHPASSADNFTQKHFFQSETANLTSRKMLQLNYGKFQRLETLAGWWQETDNINFGMHGRYSRSKGQFKNSQFELGQLNAQVGGGISKDLTFKTKGSFKYVDYGLYGAEINKLQRKNKATDFTVSGLWSQIDKYSAELGLNIQNNNFQDRDSTDQSLDFSDSGFSLTAKFETKIRTANISVNALYYYNSFENKTNKISASQSILKLKPEITFSWKQFLTIRSGLIIQDFEIIDSASETFFSPDMEIIFTPTQNLGLELKASSGYEIINYLDSWNSNPFISSQFNILPFKKRLELQLGGEYRPVSNISFKSELKRLDWKNYAFWARDSISGVFQLNKLNNVILTSWSLMSEFDFSSAVKFKAGFRLTFDSIKKDSLLANSLNMPYIEHVSIPISLNYKMGETTAATINFDWVGPRKKSLKNKAELRAYGLLSLRLQKQLFKNYSVYFVGQNLLDQKYEQWENFPGRGIYFETGLRGSW